MRTQSEGGKGGKKRETWKKREREDDREAEGGRQRGCQMRMSEEERIKMRLLDRKSVSREWDMRLTYQSIPEHT